MSLLFREVYIFFFKKESYLGNSKKKKNTSDYFVELSEPRGVINIYIYTALIIFTELHFLKLLDGCFRLVINPA